MVHSSLQKRSALHHRRGLNIPGAAAAVGQTSDVTPTPKPKAPSPVDPTKETTTTAPGVIPALVTKIPIGIPATSDTTSLQTTSIVSSTTVSVTLSVTTPSLPTTRRVPTTSIPSTPTIQPVIVQVTSFPTSTQTPSPSAVDSSGISTATIIGGIGGALGGTLLLTVIIGFLLRRWRKRKANEFDASLFRRSAILLDDDDIPRSGPRPPTMIERRNNASPPLSAPPVAYPYFDQSPVLSSAPLSNEKYAQFYVQNGTNQAQYGVVPLQSPSFAAGNSGANPYVTEYGEGDPFVTYAGPDEQSDYGAPPIPGTHGPGTYASYGVNSRYPQHPYAQQHHFSQYQTEGSGSGSFSTSNVPSNSGLVRGTSLATCRSAQSYEAPPAYMGADVFERAASSSSLEGMNSSSVVRDTNVAGTRTTSKSNGVQELRPVSSYDPGDAYGGI